MPCYGALRARRWVAWRKSYPSPNSSQRRRKTLSTASSLQPTSSHERVTRSLSDAFTGKFYYGYVITYLPSLSVCISLPIPLPLPLPSDTWAAWAPRSTCTRPSRSSWRSPRTRRPLKCRCGPCTLSHSLQTPEGLCSGRKDPLSDQI